MIKKIIRSGDPVLRTVSKPVLQVDKKVLSLIKDLKDTLKAQKDPEGVGLAACQIGKNQRVFVMAYNEGIKTVINPEIIGKEKTRTKKSGKDRLMEGCLSLPYYYGPLVRLGKITIKYLDEEGKAKTETFTGLTAQIIQHEIDHLNGILFIDRLFEQKRRLYKLTSGEWEEVEF